MFDRLGLVAETEDKIGVPVVGVVFHHMPQDRHVADSDQRFRDVLRMIFQPHSKTTAKEYDFLKVILSELGPAALFHRIQHKTFFLSDLCAPCGCLRRRGESQSLTIGTLERLELAE